MSRPTPEPAGPGQESVWDYPRPPRIERCPKLLEVRLGQRVIASTTAGWRVLETSHPPVYYFPPADVRTELLRPSAQQSFCEWKGRARYFDVVIDPHVLPGVVFQYPEPSPGAAELAGCYSFYAGELTGVVDGEWVTPQPGGFYSGWITHDLAGPFKGGPGSHGW
ncbi:MAG: DUF427 domain-containing protein [Planctomycetes bacterium]|nr:DUF427 domain-containing protein [Planctomycetota bacterium]